MNIPLSACCNMTESNLYSRMRYNSATSADSCVRIAKRSLSWRSSAESIAGSSSFLLLLDGVAMSWVFLRMWYKASSNGDVIIVGWLVSMFTSVKGRAGYLSKCVDSITMGSLIAKIISSSFNSLSRDSFRKWSKME